MITCALRMLERSSLGGSQASAAGAELRLGRGGTGGRGRPLAEDSLEGRRHEIEAFYHSAAGDCFTRRPVCVSDHQEA
jgi:hypothetical protein